MHSQRMHDYRRFAMGLIVVACAILTAACSTMQHGRYQTIRVESDPSGATVENRCGRAAPAHAITPVNLRVPRRTDSCSIVVSHDGFHAETITFESSLNRSFWMNFAPAGVGMASGMARSSEASFLDFIGGATVSGIFFGIDALTGALWRWSPTTVNVKLLPR